jgi:hypothetical protein
MLQFKSLFIACLAALLLAGCTSLQLATPYDPAIEAGLDEYDKSVSVFLKTQEQDQMSVSTLYGSADSNAFYRDSEATLSNIILHAEAVSMQSDCIPEIATRSGLTQTITNIAGAREFQGLAPDDPRFLVSLQDGSCTVVALKAVRANNYILEAMHRKNGRLRPGAASLARSLIEDSIRIALRIEKAKRG